VGSGYDLVPAFEAGVIAALYVQTDGVYYALENVEPWDEEADARRYDGPWPVVAHPPCARWSRLAGFTEARYGYKRGEDGGCFAAALDAVRRFGGVIEHPAFSSAWDKFNLPEPMWKGGWTYGLDGGASCYVEQGRYGLPVKKATWLYAYGVELPELRWGYTPDGEGDGPGGMDYWRDEWKPKNGAEPIRGYFKGNRHNGLRSRTPEEFRNALIDIAETANVRSPSGVENRG
jgi:hypothetical protein